LRHVQVGTDEHTLATGLAGGGDVGKAQNVHGGQGWEWKNRAGHAGGWHGNSREFRRAT
jgi:hypothetical protein